MTKNEILEEIYYSEIVNKMAEKYRKDLKGDFQEYISFCYETLCLMDESKLIKLYNEKSLYFYIVSICKNQVINSNSDFNRLMQNNIEKISLDAEDYKKRFCLQAPGSE